MRARPHGGDCSTPFPRVLELSRELFPSSRPSSSSSSPLHTVSPAPSSNTAVPSPAPHCLLSCLQTPLPPPTPSALAPSSSSLDLAARKIVGGNHRATPTPTPVTIFLCPHGRHLPQLHFSPQLVQVEGREQGRSSLLMATCADLSYPQDVRRNAQKRLACLHCVRQCSDLDSALWYAWKWIGENYRSVLQYHLNYSS